MFKRKQELSFKVDGKNNQDNIRKQIKWRKINTIKWQK